MRQTGREKNIRSVIGFELFLKIACLSFSFPLFRILFDFCLWAAGYSYVTKENLIRFLFSPCVLVCFFLITIGIILLAVWEANAVFLAVRYGMAGRSIAFPDLVFQSMENTKSLFRKMRKKEKNSLRHFLAAIKGKGIGVGIIKRILTLVAAEGIVYSAVLVGLIVIVTKTTDSELSGVLLLRIFERYRLICAFLVVSVNIPMLEYFCAEQILRNVGRKSVQETEEKRMTRNEGRKRIFLWFASAVVLTVAVTQTVSFCRNRSVLFSEALDELCITAHRGASERAPENTMASIALAVEEGADYAEIDVRLTADGVPVLLHDNALFRTTGVLKNLNEVTYEELTTYDAGVRYASEFTGEKVPRLEDVLEEYGGQIGFNIELKEKQDYRLACAVVALIEEYGVEESCVITSVSYQQLIWVKELNDRLKTGYILSMVYGDFYESEAADFFSIRSDYVTETVVEKSHALGKEVHVWTVNREKDLKRMKAMGVDNIITDRPAYAREIVGNTRMAESLEEWITLFTLKK